jgi:hypothetical protein
MQSMALHPKSRAYDPSYRPSKSLAQLVAENPNVQFLQDRLSEQRVVQKEMTRTQSLVVAARRNEERLVREVWAGEGGHLARKPWTAESRAWVERLKASLKECSGSD